MAEFGGSPGIVPSDPDTPAATGDEGDYQGSWRLAAALGVIFLATVLGLVACAVSTHRSMARSAALAADRAHDVEMCEGLASVAATDAEYGDDAGGDDDAEVMDSADSPMGARRRSRECFHANKAADEEAASLQNVVDDVATRLTHL